MSPLDWLRAVGSVLAALVVSVLWLGLTGYWVSVSDFSQGFGALARGEALSVEARGALWGSGYRIQYFVSYLLPVLHAGSVTRIQRWIFPERSGFVALLSTLPGTFVLVLVGLLVFYDSVATFMAVSSFLAAATVLTLEPLQGAQV